MAEVTRILIGIQARSTSERLPGKCFLELDGKPVLQHVIDACERSAIYMNRHGHKTRTLVTTALLIPYKDEIKDRFRGRPIIVEGPEDDVLTRYRVAADRLDADYIVRVTGDCPLLPPPVITKHIKVALMNETDYVSNVDENMRTAIDGFDVEVISKRALRWADENARTPAQREHVTLALREIPLPEDYRVAHVVGYLNLSHLKLSLDTWEDFERIQAHYEATKRALEQGEARHGRQSLHRF